MSTHLLSFSLNGIEQSIEVDPTTRLIDLLRESFGLTGTKEGCGKGECGTCTVLLDKKPVNACLILAGQCQGSRVRTIEGVDDLKTGIQLKDSFVMKGAVQCGFCTPGMIISGAALLIENPSPTEEEIKRAIEGNLCRCTGYVKIIEAIKNVSMGLTDRGKSS